MKEHTEVIPNEKGVWIDLTIQVHFTMDDALNETWHVDDDEMMDTVRNVVQHELGKTDYCDQYMINEVHMEDYSILRPVPKKPTKMMIYDLFEAHANELLNNPSTYKLDKLDAAKLLRDSALEGWYEDLKAAKAQGDEGWQEVCEAEILDWENTVTYDEVKNTYFEYVANWDPNPYDLLKELLHVLVEK